MPKLTNGVDIELDHTSIDYGDVQITFKILKPDVVKKFLEESKIGDKLGSAIPTGMGSSTVRKTALVTANDKSLTFARAEEETQVPLMAFQGLTAIVCNEILQKNSQNRSMLEKIAGDVAKKASANPGKVPDYVTKLISQFPSASEQKTSAPEPKAKS